LDVLCQQLLGMAVQRAWSPNEAFALVRGAYPYRNLPHRDFDDCLAYLFGQDAGGNAWLPPRLRWVGNEFAIADQRTAPILRPHFGTIIADEPRSVCLLDSECGDQAGPQGTGCRPPGSPLGGPRQVGQVDDPFADRLQPGDRFLLDGRS